MRVAILGSTGQLGWELQQTVPEGIELQCFDRQQLDLSSLTSEALHKYCAQPLDMIINCAAYTAVDKAESDKQAAYQVNALAVKTLARFCAEASIRLIHISTDFVFDGQQSQPYKPNDKKNPQSVYGTTKAAGEDFLLHENPQATCIRTSWVYSSHGHNFVKTMLKLMNERDLLSIVADQMGSPTWANDLAQCIWQLNPVSSTGLLHFSNEGSCTWYDFANAIYLLGKQKGLITGNCQLTPINTADYPTPAKRPAFSLLDKTDTPAKIDTPISHWLPALDKMLNPLL